MATDQVKLELPHETIKKTLAEVIKNKGLVDYEIELLPGCDKGDNFAGIVYKIVVNGINETDGEKANLSLFCKLPQSLPDTERNKNKIFIREIRLYTDIIIEIKKFEADKAIENGFNAYVECIATGLIPLQEFIIMEDITKRNFSMFDRKKKLDLNHTKLVMQAIGKFHAHSFAMRDQRPEILKKYSTELKDVFLCEEMDPHVKTLLNHFLKASVESLKFEGIYQEKWEIFHKNYFRIIKDCVKGQFAEPYATICHGDCWNNNMMFKYDNGLPVEVCLLDWQICRYASPVLDIIYYIFCCTEKTFRDEHYQSLLQIYYESCSSFLRQLGSDPEILFPYTEFQNQLKKFGKFGLGMAIMHVPLVMGSREDAMGLREMMKQDSSHTINSNKMHNILYTRLSDCLKDMVDLGYL